MCRAYASLNCDDARVHVNTTFKSLSIHTRWLGEKIINIEKHAEFHPVNLVHDDAINLPYTIGFIYTYVLCIYEGDAAMCVTFILPAV